MAPQSKSREQLELQGERRTERIRENPKFDGIPEEPSYLTAEGRLFWRQHVPDLVRGGVAKAVDAPALYALAESWADYMRAQLEVSALETTSTVDGKRAVSVAQSSRKSFLDAAAKFAMTPLSRNVLDLKDAKAIDASGDFTA